MGHHRVVVIPGDGIGPEVMAATQRVIAATGVEIEWRSFEVGMRALEAGGPAMPAELLQEVRACGLALKGPVATPIGSGFSSVTVGLRQSLDLYANLRPVKSMPGVPTRYEDVDLVIVRENTEDLYVGLERQVDNDTVEAIKRITRPASLRIARFAFEYAREHGRRLVTTVHKANILKRSDGLFLDCARQVAAEYPDVRHRDRIVDALCLDLVSDPSLHDVLLCPNLYGDIVSDLAAGLVGGLGLVPSANIGDGVALFEAVHGTAPDIAGKRIANPTALILAAVMLLARMGEAASAARVRRALETVYWDGRCLTPDVGGRAGTEEFTDAVIGRLA